MTPSEHWVIAPPAVELSPRAVAALLEEALAARGLAPGVAVIDESGELEGARIEAYGRYLHVALGVGELRGAFTVARAGDDPEADPAYAEIHGGEVRGAWEPLYRLFAEVALALGAAQEPALAAELDPGELGDDVRATVDACIADALYAEGLDAGDAAVAAAAGGAPLEAFGVEVDYGAGAIAVRVVGAGERLEVVARGAGAALSAAGRAALEAALREDLGERVAYHRWLRHQRAAPPADPARAGGVWLERRAAGALVAAAPLAELGALRAALAEGDADVIRYFASGAPYWKASYERGHALDAELVTVDDLHADRTWQWDAAAEAAGAAPPEEPEEPGPAARG